MDSSRRSIRNMHLTCCDENSEPSYMTAKKIGSLIATQVARMQDEHADKGWEYPGQARDELFYADYAHIGHRTCGSCDRQRIQPRGKRRDDKPWVHDGLIASGPVVLKDAKSRASLQDVRVLAVEMEACGVPKIFIVVRGISDYADSHKNDIWQPYAAATAAACARLMINEFVKRPQVPVKSAPLLRPLASLNLGDEVGRSGPDVSARESTPPANNYAMSTESRISFPPTTSTDRASSHRGTVAEDGDVLTSSAMDDLAFHKDTLDHTYQYLADKVKITLSNQGSPKLIYTEKSLEACQVFLDVGGDDRIENIRRRLRVRHHRNLGGWRTYSFWLPLTDFVVKRDHDLDGMVQLMFSNCKHTTNEASDTKAHADSMLNKKGLCVDIGIWLNTYEERADPNNRLLHREDERIFFHQDAKYQSHRNCEIQCGFIESAGYGPVRSLLVWLNRVTDCEGEWEQIQAESVSFGGLSSKLDFHLQKQKRENGRAGCTTLTLRYMRKLTYRLPEVKDVASWLRLESHDANNPGQISTRLTDGSSPESTLDIQMDDTNVVQVLNQVISPLVRWVARDWFEVKAWIFDEIPRARWIPYRSQLTVWNSKALQKNCDP